VVYQARQRIGAGVWAAAPFDALDDDAIIEL